MNYRRPLIHRFLYALFTCSHFFFFHIIFAQSAPLTVSYSIDADKDWGTGYQVSMTIKNPTTQPTTAWRVIFTLPQTQKISSLWNGQYTISGNTVTVTQPAWWGGNIIGPNQTTSIGFVVTNAQASQSRTLLNISAIGTFQTAPPPTPLSTPVLQPITNPMGVNQFQLNWTAVPTAQSYTVQQAITSNFSQAQTVFSGNTLTAAISVLTPGTYYYRVIASAGSNTSAPSNIQSTIVVPQPIPPTPSERPIIDGYWESWNSTDPINSIATMHADVINISFGKFMQTGTHQFIVNGIDANQTTLTQFVNLAHAAGKKVKISIGGATYPLIPLLKTVDDAAGMAQAIAQFLVQNNIDGVDYDIEDFPTADLQVALLQKTRQLLGNSKLITYTPMAPAATTAPYNQVIKNGHQYCDYISIMAYNAYAGYSFEQDAQALISMGVPASKIVIGLMPGRDDVGALTSVADINRACDVILKNKLRGIMFWSLNRDYANQTGLGAQAATNTAFTRFST